ncbi:hypothetical protein EDF18_2187 [Frigoribacterium sp. PhB107]|uniref:LysM peptidoglycan-binding domain-containing protein n=1 Tax=Frigoribacterium sp. PhB107 TaxID=2485172 RepID=UPI000F48869D|nr:LysM domain-containing protein [Frigoribacterium sp. PhB107]ROP75567.1 hypothetical protein EDF18_2187 [Frigoribacterium sp. PhB107]
MTDDHTPGPHDDDVERDGTARGHEAHGDDAAAAEQAPVDARDGTAGRPGTDEHGGGDERPGADDTSTRATTQPTEVQPAAPTAHTSADEPAPTTGAGPRLVPWTHRPTTSEGTAGSAAASSGRSGAAGAAGATGAAAASADTDSEDDEPGRRRMRPAAILAVVGGAAVVAVVLGTVLAFSGGGPLASGAPAATSEPASPITTSARPSTSPTPSATPTASASPSPRAATPPPAEAAEEAPYVTPVAAGTVVAEADVRSPKGSIAFHYRVVAVGDGTFSTEWSGYTSTLPVTVQLSYFEIAPAVFDGLTSPGDGVAVLGGPTSAPTSGSAPLPIGQPSYLGTLVVSTAEAAPDVPVEISRGKVLAVAPVRWSVPAKTTNIVPVDGGVANFANGVVTATTAAGAPKRYQVSTGDTADAVAARFGITVSALIYLNQGLEVIDDEQRLFDGTELLLDPDSL